VRISRVLATRLTAGPLDVIIPIRATREAFAPLGATVHVVGSATNAGSRRTRRRLARYRVGAEGRISHLKRAYGARRSRLRGTTGAAIWTNWAILAYDLDTAAALPPRRPRSARATRRAA
jgi:hypothetical protein